MTLKAVRNQLSTHIIEIEMNTQQTDKVFLHKTLEQCRVFQNNLVGFMTKNLNRMKNTSEYHKLIKEYKKTSEKIESAKDKVKLKELNKSKKEIGQELNKLYETHNVTKKALEDLSKVLTKRKQFNKVDSVIGQTIANKVWSGTEKILFKNGKTLHFKPFGTVNSFEGKQAHKIIMLKQDSNGDFFVSFQGKKFPLIVKENDLFVLETFARMKHYIQNEQIINDDNLNLHAKGKQPIDTYRAKYLRIVRKDIRGKARFYVQIAVEGIAVPKRKKDGFFRHILGVGRVAGDVGTRSVATVSDTSVELKNLSHKVLPKTFRKHEKLGNFLQRSRRVNNPQNFNINGVPKKKSECTPWVKSKKYRKKQQKRRDLFRKERINRILSHNQDANRYRTQGDIFITEPSNASAIAKKAKEVTINQKTGKFYKRKRMGESVGHHSPGDFHARVKRKFESTGGKYEIVNIWTYKASQYDHKLNENNKKQLSQRWHTFQDGEKVQRDSYSSFLMYCSDKNFEKPVHNLCNTEYERFKKLHDKCIEDIKIKGKTIYNSGIK